MRVPVVYDAVCKHWTEVGDKNGQPDYKLHKLQQVYRIATRGNPREATKTQNRFGEKVFQEFMRDEMLATISKSAGRDCYTNVVLRA